MFLSVFFQFRLEFQPALNASRECKPIFASSDASVLDLYSLCAAVAVTSLMDSRRIRTLGEETNN